jgi:aspartyl aminopeptidase
MDPLVADFVAWLNESWTAYHAVEEAKRRLLAAGFQELSEAGDVEGCVRPNGKYFVTRNMSALVAFAVGGKHRDHSGFTIVGAHTDSPCPKLKPSSKCTRQGYLSLSIQPYGGGLWHTWFDRDLSVAGRVIVRKPESAGAGFEHKLVKILRPICRIPTLAIHLSKGDERTNFQPNLQSHGYPVLASTVKADLERPTSRGGALAEENGEEKEGGKADAMHHPLLLKLLAEELSCDPEDIVDFELQLCDTQPSAVGGALNEFVFSGRLDNLCSSWQSLTALIDSVDSLAEEESVRMVALFDHEEVGSSSAHGAGGTLIPEMMRRISSGLLEGSTTGAFERSLRKSYVVSADMAHAIHPNYADRHDPGLAPMMHKGMVLKHNANQRYATTAVTGFLWKEIGRRAGLPTQEFCVRADTGCGSTIGPIISTLSGIRTVDVGSPQWSMHSCREVMGTDDVVHGYKHIKAVFETFTAIDRELHVDGP